MTYRDAPLPPFTLMVRSLTAVALGTGSFLLAVTPPLFGGSFASFFVGNRLPLRARLWVLGIAGLGAGLAALVVLLGTRSQEDPNATRLRIAKLTAPLVVSCFVPVLFQQEAWSGKELAFLAFTLALGLGLERLVRLCVEAAEPKVGWRFLTEGWFWGRRLPRRLLGGVPLVLTATLAIAYAYRVGVLTNVSHLKMATMSSDLAEYDNLFFNALHGHPFRSPAIAGHLEDFSTLQGHAEFGLYLLLPFYAISPGAHALLWIQSALVGLTAIPVFLLGRTRLGSLGGLCFAVAFLMAPAVQQPNFYDFHFTALGMHFIAWLLYFTATLAQAPRSRWRRAALYAVLGLAFLCREDMSIGTAVLGAFLVLTGTLVRDGVVIAILSGIYFVTMKFGVMPLFGRWWFDTMYEDVKAEGAHGFGAVILTVLSNPSFTLRTMLTEPKLLYVLHMTVPVLALWLRRPLFWLAFLPGLVSTLLVTNRPPMYMASFQYTYFWVPYVFAASMLATHRDSRRWGVLVALVITAATLSYQLGAFPAGDGIMGGFSRKTFAVTPADETRYAQLRSIIARIPPEATVAATEAEGPHVSSRLIMYSLKYTLGKDPEYLLVGLSRLGGEVAHIRQALESGKYGVVAQEGPFILAKRGASPASAEPLWQRIGGRRRPAQ